MKLVDISLCAAIECDMLMLTLPEYILAWRYSSYQVLQLSRLLFMIVEFPDGSRSIFVHPQTHFAMNLVTVTTRVVDSRQTPASSYSPAKYYSQPTDQPAPLFPLPLRKGEWVKKCCRQANVKSTLSSWKPENGEYSIQEKCLSIRYLIMIHYCILTHIMSWFYTTALLYVKGQ